MAFHLGAVIWCFLELYYITPTSKSALSDICPPEYRPSLKVSRMDHQISHTQRKVFKLHISTHIFDDSGNFQQGSYPFSETNFLAYV